MTTTTLPKKNSNKQVKNGQLHYFTIDHENAIIQYARSDNRKEREKLYIEFIGPAFNEMVDKIIYTYKFTNLPNIDSLKQECKLWLVTILDKYKPEKGSKAFSYYSVITKNWFIHKVKKNAIQYKKEVQYEDVSHDQEANHLTIYNDYDQIRETDEFNKTLYKEFDDWDDSATKDTDLKVLEGIKYLFRNADSVDIFNKKAVYLLLREITGLNTKQVVSALNKFKPRYKDFKKYWDSVEN